MWCVDWVVWVAVSRIEVEVDICSAYTTWVKIWRSELIVIDLASHLSTHGWSIDYACKVIIMDLSYTIQNSILSSLHPIILSFLT